jgi:CBS domain-containing protein
VTLTLVSPRADIGQLAVRAPVVVPSTCTIREAARTMRGADVSSALIAGMNAIVTERDLAVAVAEGRDGTDAVSSIASAHPVVVEGHTPIAEAAAVMLNRGVRHLIVHVGDDVGVVSLRDVMDVLLQALEPSMGWQSLRFGPSSSSELWLG